jgi:hypothetical protein
MTPAATNNTVPLLSDGANARPPFFRGGGEKGCPPPSRTDTNISGIGARGKGLGQVAEKSPTRRFGLPRRHYAGSKVSEKATPGYSVNNGMKKVRDVAP